MHTLKLQSMNKPRKLYNTKCSKVYSKQIMNSIFVMYTSQIAVVAI